MLDRIRITLIVLCLLATSQFAICEENQDLDVGKSIFKKEKTKKIKVKKPKKTKEYKIKDSILDEYSIPTDVYMNVGEKIKNWGRIQSRLYEKKFEDGTVETRRAYEVSVSKMEIEKQSENEELSIVGEQNA